MSTPSPVVPASTRFKLMMGELPPLNSTSNLGLV